MDKIYNVLQNDGTKWMFKFGYVDDNGEYYSNFADASRANSGKGASYGAFLALADDADPCWEFDELAAEYGVSVSFSDRELTEDEEIKFLLGYHIHLMKILHGGEAAVRFIDKLITKLNN